MTWSERNETGTPNLLFGAKTPKDLVKGALTNELVIVLCGPIGAPLHTVAERLHETVTDRFNYISRVIKLSDFIENKYPAKNASTESHFNRVMRLIEGGNELRHKFGGSTLADLAIHAIHLDRHQQGYVEDKETQKIHFRPRRVCHIIDSIKNQEELNILRSVYRDMLYCIGVLSPLQLRVDYLKRRDLKDPEIHQLIDRDSGEEIPHGQTVRDTFPQADFFLRIGSHDHKEIDVRLERFLHIVLGSQVITPTIEEQAMYLAASSSTNSACLSRQVGAAVTDSQGNVLGVGWNDVPRSGGGLYSATNTSPDKRCINIDGGICHNDQKKDKLREEIATALNDSGVIKSEDFPRALAAMGTSKIRDLLEFSRSIHAEMHAIITAAQKTGDRMIGGRLFCTTYPCHSCARHIVAAGIKTLFYIEPYRKSLALELHSDAISELESEIDKVRILPFDGVAPNRYMELFRMQPNSRKREGRKSVISPREAMHKSNVSLEPFTYLEGAIVRSLIERELIKVAQEDATRSSHETQKPAERTTPIESSDSPSRADSRTGGD